MLSGTFESLASLRFQSTLKSPQLFHEVIEYWGTENTTYDLRPFSRHLDPEPPPEIALGKAGGLVVGVAFR